MPVREALFWMGLTVFGTGLYFTVEKENVRLPYAIVLIVVGLAGVVYSVLRHHYPDRKLPAIRAWIPLLVMTWAAFAYNVYTVRTQKPKIVTQIIEKPVEKIVPQECPQPKQTKESKRKPRIIIPPGTKIEATTKAPDSAAVGINTGTVTVNPPVNPYAPIHTYDFNGARRTSEPGKMNLDVGEETIVFQKFVQLQTARDWKGLRDTCEEQIKKAPQWLTPYLFAGVAYANLGDKAKAIERLMYVKTKAGENPDYADAERLLGKLQPQN